ncbi:hypothetical protein BKA66DRAFT_546436 [Pyrenochaeta sp. MPI-SDFR-AT-0127]|nr:hypothetical protein BKA66DRAFT_546436 [Pyrenochaeta sp. MPI-SDFR-AT-0127]
MEHLSQDTQSQSHGPVPNRVAGPDTDTDMDACLDDIFTQYTDPDIYFDGAAEQSQIQSESITHDLQPAELAILTHAGDASQAAHSVFGMRARLCRTTSSSSTAPLSTNSQLGDAPYDLDDVSDMDTEMPNIKRRKTEDGCTPVSTPSNCVSSGTNPTARSSLLTTATARSSVLSTSTTRSSVLSTSTSRSSVSSISTNHLSTDETYECPVCNMGKGAAQRTYTRKREAADNGDTSRGTPETTLQSNPRQVKRPGQFKSVTWFNNHMTAHHQELFRRTNSEELLCLFCPCATVMGQPKCTGRFESVDDLLLHLLNNHSKPSDVRTKFHHWCPPLSTRSYPRQILEKLKNLKGPSSA